MGGRASAASSAPSRNWSSRNPLEACGGAWGLRLVVRYPPTALWRSTDADQLPLDLDHTSSPDEQGEAIRRLGYAPNSTTDRRVTVKIPPVGVDVAQHRFVVAAPEALATLRDLSLGFKDRIVLLGVGDVDLFKGIGLKLLAMATATTPSSSSTTLVSTFEKAAYYAAAECVVVSAVRDGLNRIPYIYTVYRELLASTRRSPKPPATSSSSSSSNGRTWRSALSSSTSPSFSSNRVWRSTPSSSSCSSPASPLPLTRCFICVHNEPRRHSRLRRSRWSTRRRRMRCRMGRRLVRGGGRPENANSELLAAGTFVDTCQDSFDEFPDVDGSPLANAQTNLSRLVSNGISLAAYQAA
ncbi:uncharacterized protein LOC109705584 [Ananas comosus]|uniref:Uncharacterized protein LOC109705584 n=1 Tax=Ananas comosus TaxID=4615 RepID=A0A6P5EKI0_ANACO|nr:uncharacterized protein LOC109705584 [Ananas comosus]